MSLIVPQLRVAVATGVLLLLCGTFAFKVVGGEQWTLLDAFYMTVITVTTVGFEEVHPLTAGGRLVAVSVMLSGVGIAVYVTGTLAEVLIEGKIFARRRVSRAVSKMNDHFIVCGYGRVGRAICRALREHRVPFVVVAQEEPAGPEREHFIVGDATDDDVLLRAGIRRARGLVSALGSDAENLYIVLAARSLRQDLFIVSRCSEPRSYKKLLAAGAQRVISPYRRTGTLIAQMMVRPQVVDFFEEASRREGLEIVFEQIHVGAESQLAGVTLRDSPIRRDLDIIVAAMLKASGDWVFNPSPDERIVAGDMLIVMGQPGALDRLARIASGERIDDVVRGENR
ncbi:MAG: potassium channel protein [Acidobacteriota bacterium]|nr:MAG: potassium channel protein [Acidobacteriota bacterium]